MSDEWKYFTAALDFQEHPAKCLKLKEKKEYWVALIYILHQVLDEYNFDDQVIFYQYIQNRLEQYKELLLVNEDISFKNNEIVKDAHKITARCLSRLYKSKQLSCILCDIGLLLLDQQLILHAKEVINSFLSNKKKDVDLFFDTLSKNDDQKLFTYVQPLVSQYRTICAFENNRQRRFIVTANISAGKSTLINALIGKPLARTSQEVCTGNICNLYNKPFEDERIHLKTSSVQFNANMESLRNYDWKNSISIASYFSGIEPIKNRICIIDTPGVNAASYREHSEITHKALLNCKYDKLLYVISPTNLGTDAEMRHLKWVTDNIPKDKVIFVLNKLDNYNSNSDSIEESVKELRSDLDKLGYDNPIICPISAYFGLLIKMKNTGQILSEDELDEYTMLAKKFKRPSYDLSHFYDNVTYFTHDTEYIRLSKASGLYGLEKIIYGGAHMKKVFIKYNPYKLETELTVDGKKLAQNSKIGELIFQGSRLQEWVEELPQILIDEYNDTDYDITFHGTLLDFEDLTEVFTQAFDRRKFTVKFERIPAKETSDKEGLIDEVFKKIQKGPFAELKDKEILSAFEHAKSSDFEVCVVATMSAGKSTLINSMLGAKLMPSKQEACTAIITKIKDTKENDTWQAEVYSKDNLLIETHEDLTYSTMTRLNADERVSVIKANGNIPFVSSEDVSLVLIDTPGPNNSRDPEHKRVQSEFLNESSKSLVLYIMEGTFGSDDDDALLHRVAESMKVGGKQSKDRFIFVVNKMDDRRKEDGDTAQTLDRIHAYLKGHGITNPNLFPAAALPALNIRLMQSGAEMDEDTIDETEMKVRKLNRNETLHLENYASLPASIRDDIGMKLDEAKRNGDTATEALIHTGVISVEAAIRQYVQKYAKTAKIKNIVDTFMHKLEEVGAFEKTKQELAKNIEDGERIACQLEMIRKKVDDIESAKEFENSVNDAVIKVNDDAKEIIDKIIQKYQAIIRQKIDLLRSRELNMDEVKDEVHRLEQYAKALEPAFQNDLDKLIRGNLIATSNALLQEYKKKLSSLIIEIDTSRPAGISIDPLKLMSGRIPDADKFSATELTQSKKVEDGKEWIKNTDKKWYKPWTWFQEDGYYRTKYKTVKYVPANELAQVFFAPIKEGVIANGNFAQKYAIKQSNHIAKVYYNEFKRLDAILKEKLSELGRYATDKTLAEKRIKETEARLKWLEDIQKQVNSILEI